ncbi:hypothetical protein Q2941_50790 [Bradyrhizobium sp. UFLA05-153]
MDNLQLNRQQAAEADLLTYAASLARAIDHDWAARGHRSEDFAPLAQAALDRSQPHRAIDLDAALPRLAAAEALPVQIDAARVSGPLSKCSVTLFADDRLQVDLNVWFVAPMIVHDHNYHAAFALLRGQSYEERFTWDEAAQAPDGLATGTLSTDGRRWLSTGDIAALTPFEGCIHRVWHLDFPSVSLFVNTRARGGQAGRSFDESGLAFPYPLTPTLPIADMKRLHLYESALRNGIGDAMACLVAATEVAGPLTLFHMLQRLLSLASPADHWAHLGAVAEQRLPGLGARFAAYRAGQARWSAVDWTQRGTRDELIALAALMSAESPAALAEFLAQTPLRSLADLACALEGAQRRGCLAEPLPDLAFDVLPELLAGASDDAVRERLAQSFGAEVVAATGADIGSLLQRLRQSTLLARVIPHT